MMEPTLAQTLLTTALKASTATLKPGYTNGGVAIQWDLQNSQLLGSFRIHLTEDIDVQSGTYTIMAADFLQPSLPASSAPPTSSTLPTSSAPPTS